MMLLHMKFRRNRVAPRLIGLLCGSVLLLLLGSCPTSVRAQISPGPLSRAHQTLSGSLNCAKCHDLGAGGVQLKCLECHTEIRQRLVQRRGLHATFVGPNATGKDCVRCHSEHNGADFPIVRWEPNREALDHSKTGFPLIGRHAVVSCEGCHKAADIPVSARQEIRVKDLNHTYLGLSQDCASCHPDEHHRQLSTNCSDCHDVNGWRPAPRFVHSTTKYQLTGAHATVACAKCHPSIPDTAKPYVKYTGLSFATCTGCHADPHKGAFTASCQSCHNTANWKRVAQLEGFDHSKTEFPLLGKHRTVACSDCHTHGDFKTPVAYAKCSDCHADAHNKQFLTRPDGGDCAACHNVDGFKPATFDVKAHAATAYPLEGRHTMVSCDQCHLPRGKATVFKITQTQCIDCHQDVHRGQFVGAPHQNRCEDCHDVQGFRPAQFTLARHQQTRFPLTAAHLAVPCTNCHVEVAAASVTPVKYQFEDRSCTACHQDPHRGEFRDRMETRRANGGPMGCEACHTIDTWKELNRFDHSTTKFPLIGAHRGVACADCHRPPVLERTLEHVDFRAAPKQCSGCHEDPHAGQFVARRDVTDCSSCHDSLRWKPAHFDHNTRTKFTLQGAHENVACGECHNLKREVNRQVVIFYRPTPTECKACHGN